MTAIAMPDAPIEVQSAEPHARRWTREEFHRMADLGLFVGQRAELIDGEIMVLSPQKAQHFTTTERVVERLRDAFGAGYYVRMQGPLAFGAQSEPEPDVAVVVGSREQYGAQHPSSAVLIVEVSDTTLNSDRSRKASLYARANVADYWIVNLVDRKLEVRRTPVADSSQPYGHGYTTLVELVPPATVTPLAATQVSLAVADLIG
jgi:Uma2 family endonuclease